MSSKSASIGLVSLFAVLAAALGGCSTSVGRAAETTPTSATAYLTAPPVVASKPLARTGAPVAQAESRQALAALPDALTRRRVDCGH